jgi:hypothetical protein
MIMSYRYHNKNVLFGSMRAGGRYGREITNGAKRTAPGEDNGNGNARRANHKSGGQRAESEL